MVVVLLKFNAPVIAIRSLPDDMLFDTSKRSVPPVSVNPPAMDRVAAVPVPPTLMVPALDNVPVMSVAGADTRPPVSVWLAPSAKPPLTAEILNVAPEVIVIALLLAIDPVAFNVRVPAVMLIPPQQPQFSNASSSSRGKLPVRFSGQ